MLSIFVLPTKLVELTLKRRCTVLCFTHGEGASATVVVCYDRGVGRGVVSSYGRPKFATQYVALLFTSPFIAL